MKALLQGMPSALPVKFNGDLVESMLVELGEGLASRAQFAFKLTPVAIE